MYTDLIGNRFGKLTVKKFVGVDKRHNSIWECVCDCGTIKSVRKYNLKNGSIQSCGCMKNRLLPYEWLYHRVKYTAKKTGRKLGLSFDDFLFFTKISQCHYCGTNIKWIPFFKDRSCACYYLDRKNNDEGYTKENCVVCCQTCNWVKGDSFSYEEMKILGKTIETIFSNRNRKNLSPC